MWPIREERRLEQNKSRGEVVKAGYNKRVWLNSKASSFTGSITCNDQKCVAQDGKLYDWAFVEIADCSKKVRIHIGDNRNYKTYIRKVRKMRDELTKYIEHLEQRVK